MISPALPSAGLFMGTKERLRPIRPYVSQIGCNDSVSAFMVLPATTTLAPSENGSPGRLRSLTLVSK